jgi:transcriptional regulator with XRE-family HTH domain
MVRRKQVGLSHKQLAAKTGIRLHWLRRWEFDRFQPSQSDWDRLRKFINLPATPVLTFTQAESDVGTPQTLGSQLRKRRLELKLCLAEVAPKIGVAVPTLGLWELNKVFPKNCYHAQVTAFLGYNPFP